MDTQLANVVRKIISEKLSGFRTCYKKSMQTVTILKVMSWMVTKLWISIASGEDLETSMDLC